MALFGLKGPSVRGPTHLSYIFLGGTPVGVIDFKWRVEWSQIDNLRLLPECYDEGSLSMILKGLEQEAKLMGHRGGDPQDQRLPIRVHLETLIGEVLLNEGYAPEGEWLIKHMEEHIAGA